MGIKSIYLAENKMQKYDIISIIIWLIFHDWVVVYNDLSISTGFRFFSASDTMSRPYILSFQRAKKNS